MRAGFRDFPFGEQLQLGGQLKVSVYSFTFPNISAIPPTFMKLDKNPDGVPKEVVDGLRDGTANRRSQFYKDITIPFYGFNRPGAVVSEGIRENWWRQGMMGGIKAQYDCIKALSETEFYDDLKMIDVPVLVMHGEDDQISPSPLPEQGRSSF